MEFNFRGKAFISASSRSDCRRNFNGAYLEGEQIPSTTEISKVIKSIQPPF